jgi:hypothetical protein
VENVNVMEYISKPGKLNDAVFWILIVLVSGIFAGLVWAGIAYATM